MRIRTGVRMRRVVVTDRGSGRCVCSADGRSCRRRGNHVWLAGIVLLLDDHMRNGGSELFVLLDVVLLAGATVVLCRHLGIKLAIVLVQK